MKAFVPSFLLALGLAGSAVAAPSPGPVPPPTQPLEERAVEISVAVPAGTVVGTSSDGIDSFGGIPFAEPPVGALRLKPPVKFTDPLGTFDATGTGNACPQMLASTAGNDFVQQVLGKLLDTPLFQVALSQSEDCLNVRVQRPTGTSAGDKLPVLFWIFGGGFELGWPSMYDGAPILGNAIDQNKPFIYVAINYRVGGFGFLPGKEILADGSSNLGLLDQRLGLEWVADNIASFGGDPDKVTIWGQSAGSISVLTQMILYGGNNTYNGKELFRGAIMNSGTVAPVDPVDCPKGQQIYDTVVESAGCSDAADTLDCLRALPYAKFLDAANSPPVILSYNSAALSYLPRPDGNALPESPDILVTNGQYAAVPMIVGDNEDEGTLFALFTSNITSTSKIVDYLSSLYFSGATREQLTTLVETYSPSLTEGSPFRTGLLNEIYPGFKRLAAILGDLVFTLSRRAFLQKATAVNPNVPAWSFLNSFDYGTPILGTGHGLDILQVFYGVLPNYASNATQSYYFNFLYDLDPNVGSSFPNWPQWQEDQQLVQFWNDESNLLKDDFRNESYSFVLANTNIFYV